MADVIFYKPNGTAITPYPFDGALTESTITAAGRAILDDADAAAQRTTLGAAPATGKLYLRDNAGTPHYWQLTVDAAGALTTTDVGTSAPTDGMVSTS